MYIYKHTIFVIVLALFDRVERLAQDIVRNLISKQQPNTEGTSSICIYSYINSTFSPLFYSSKIAQTSLVMICVLKGGHQFFADLLNAVKKLNATFLHQSVPIALEFLRVIAIIYILCRLTYLLYDIYIIYTFSCLLYNINIANSIAMKSLLTFVIQLTYPYMIV
jgi:hypothetical protein